MAENWQRTAVINVVGLSKSTLGEHMPFLSALAAQNGLATINPTTPALTCSSQVDYLTGKTAVEHGIVGNGWFFREECEIKFWKQSNQLVHAEKVWELCKKIDPKFTVANLFWWYNMYSSADYSVTPRPQYPADGRKIPDCYTQPPELRDELQQKLGQFPLFSFWGPNTSIISSKWISDAARHVEEKYQPTLSLVYIPHMDYCLQKFGPDMEKIKNDLLETDKLVESLFQFYRSKGVSVVILSEYGINSVSKPVHLNRIFRQNGWLQIREEAGLELLDAGASSVFAVADHQIAHVYVQKKELITEVEQLLSSLTEVDVVYNQQAQTKLSLFHPDRSGDFLVIAKPDSWFTYYYWFDDQKAPDFARTVDIHKKPGYDPVELFLDPKLRWPKFKIGQVLLKRKLGFRALMDVIPLDASLVKGSHGSPFVGIEFKPILIPTNELKANISAQIKSTDIFSIILSSLKNN
jgi:predicted AlkP superfamily pyrophosphatase or phosphodiesterase